MKGYLSVFVIIFVWCAVMPAIITAPKSGHAVTDAVADITSEAETESTPAYTPIYIRVDTEKQYELEEYTALALTALMEEGTDSEALKAQAVAIRSVVCYRHETPVHEGFELCTDALHCYKLAENARNDCIEAAEATKGLILTYNGKAAFAVSHASSCVSTENAAVIYGEEFPYLQSVEVKDESGYKAYKTQKTITTEEYKKAFDAYKPDFSANALFESLCFTEGNRVYTLVAGGLCFKGSTFARLFGLPSTCFTLTQTLGGVTINCYGEGDGVGMSRYSACLLAKEGKSFEEILAYFYDGTKLSHICVE